MKLLRVILFILPVMTAMAAGCGSTPAPDDAKAAVATDAKATAPASAETKAPAQEPDASSTAAPGATTPKTGDEVAVIDTNLGKIVLKFFPEKAPVHVDNFKKLANKKFYDGIKFHRVIPGFMIQGGDPNTKEADRSKAGTGGPGYTIKAEFNSTHHSRGMLSMARSNDPDSAGSQFFITVADADSLDNQYTLFGQVVIGMDVVDKIVALPRDERDNPTEGNEAVMKTVRIVKWPLGAPEKSPSEVKK